MFVLPWLSLTAPVVDLADPPPRPAATPPKGASRLELATGLSLVDDIGWEFDLGVVGAGYMVASKADETSTSHTVWTKLQATHYMPAESEMVAERFWKGPLIRGSIGTEIIGRHGLDPGSLTRYDFSCGLRGEAQPGITAAFGLGWAVVHDIQQVKLTHGFQAWVELMLR